MKNIALLILLLVFAPTVHAQDLGFLDKAEVVKVVPSAHNINLQVKVTHVNGAVKIWDHWLNDEQVEFATDPAVVINRAYVTAFKMLLAEIQASDDAKNPEPKPLDIAVPSASDLRLYVADLKQRIVTQETAIAAMPDTIANRPNADKATAEKELDALKRKLPQ